LGGEKKKKKKKEQVDSRNGKKKGGVVAHSSTLDEWVRVLGVAPLLVRSKEVEKNGGKSRRGEKRTPSREEGA